MSPNRIGRGRIRPVVVASVLAAATLGPVAANAQARPQPQRVLSRGLSDPAPARKPLVATPNSDRLLYGRIEKISGNVLLVRARNGRVLRVDATDALRDGTYSAPLFVGKLVLVAGYYDAAKLLHAESVTRVAHIDASTGADR